MILVTLMRVIILETVETTMKLIAVITVTPTKVMIVLIASNSASQAMNQITYSVQHFSLEKSKGNEGVRFGKSPKRNLENALFLKFNVKSKNDKFK